MRRKKKAMPTETTHQWVVGMYYDAQGYEITEVTATTVTVTTRHGSVYVYYLKGHELYDDKRQEFLGKPRDCCFGDIPEDKQEMDTWGFCSDQTLNGPDERHDWEAIKPVDYTLPPE